MRPIAIFYHTLLNVGTREHAEAIIKEQVGAMQQSGLLDQADYFFLGVNGEEEDANRIMELIPTTTIPVLNPIETWGSSEVQTLRGLRDFALGNPNHNILYLHMKGLSHVPGSPSHEFNRDWRRGMQNIVVNRWRECVAHLEAGYESVGNWWNVAPNGSYWAGNFWWATSDFIATLPPIITDGHHSGGRYEAEVWIGRGPRLPNIVAL